MIYDRIPREEALLRDEFGEQYLELESRTGRLLPRFTKPDKYISLLNQEE